MVFELRRLRSGRGWTMGRLYLRGSERDDEEAGGSCSPVSDYFVCDTLEPNVAEEAEPGRPVAIADGFYGLRLSESPKFGRLLPEVTDVAGRSGIRIHRGNTAADSRGCILVGRRRGDGLLWDSAAREASVVDLLSRVGGEHFLEVTGGSLLPMRREA